jgi:hypothetical protein
MKRQAQTDARRRYEDAHRAGLDKKRLVYKETGQNPVVVWEAWRRVRSAGFEAPEWVLRYFDRVADRVSRLSRQQNIPAKREIAPALCKAFEFRPGRGLSGRANPLRVNADRSHDLGIAASVFVAYVKGKKLDFAYDEVVESHSRDCTECASISRSTVLRSFKKYRHLFEPGYSVIKKSRTF